jgi:hypothetical protein
MVWPSRCPVCVTPRSSVSATNNSTLAPVWAPPHAYVAQTVGISQRSRCPLGRDGPSAGGIRSGNPGPGRALGIC